MAGERSEAQKEADKRYREKRKSSVTHWATELKVDEATELDALIKSKGLNRAQFLRWAISQLKTSEKV